MKNQLALQTWSKGYTIREHSRLSYDLLTRWFNYNRSSDVVTPREIVDSQVKKAIAVNPDATYLVPGAGVGTYVSALLAEGVKPSNIYAVEVNTKYYTLGSMTFSRYGVNYIHSDFLTWQSNMKFDVIIGNPPYQRPKHSEGNKNNQPLWLDFLEKSGDLLAPGGVLSMLVPSQVAKSTRWESPGKGFQTLQWGNILSIQTGLEKWFNVGTKISLVTVTTGIQGVLTVDGQEIDISKRPWIPTKTNPEAFSILDKISNQSNKLEFKLGLHHMNEKNSFGFWRLNQTFGFNPIMTSTRDKSILNRMWIGHNAEDTNQAEKLILLMKSKLFTAFRRLTFYEPNFAHLLLSGLTFPNVIPTTDQEVFDAYGLTQEEIEFVDSLAIG